MTVVPSRTAVPHPAAMTSRFATPLATAALVALSALAVAASAVPRAVTAQDSASAAVTARPVAKRTTPASATDPKRKSATKRRHASSAAKSSATKSKPAVTAAPVDPWARDSASVAAKWPVANAPAPLPGSILPAKRIVAYYGNPLSKRMGVLGEYPKDEMLAKLTQEVAHWQRVDTSVKALPALHLIVTVAQGAAGRDGKWRMRMPDTLIERVSEWAQSRDALLFLDVQVGKSTVAAELEPLVPYLKRPYVHLALDPEFSMKGKEPPGKKIGTMDAADVNVAVHLLEKLVDENKLPPKLLIVHRWTQKMLTNHAKIERDPRVQVIINMDGFGPPRLKLDSYKAYVHDAPVQYYGIKLFYKNDKPLFSPMDVMRLFPVPHYIQYQ